MFKVIWELKDGQTQDESPPMPLEDACDFLKEQAIIELEGRFNWVQVEPV
jgi:hypothetical protein